MTLRPQEFKDKNGNAIKAGDILIHRFYARIRERPGHKRVAIRGMTDQEVIVPDEGELKHSEKHWAKYIVKWDGACLIASRDSCSDSQKVMQAELFDENGKKICEGSRFHYMNSVFDSSVYEII